jgi:hypothetical protein
MSQHFTKPSHSGRVQYIYTLSLSCGLVFASYRIIRTTQPLLICICVSQRLWDLMSRGHFLLNFHIGTSITACQPRPPRQSRCAKRRSRVSVSSSGISNSSPPSPIPAPPLFAKCSVFSSRPPLDSPPGLDHFQNLLLLLLLFIGDTFCHKANEKVGGIKLSGELRGAPFNWIFPP